ncbi:MAG: MFS transporter [Fimbriimonas sp.]|nr:MFS transporter [Fimbriimonas sp.]
MAKLVVPNQPATSKDGIEVRSWPAWTVWMMIIGYAGYYLCRSDFSVAKPLILDAYKHQGVNKETLGIVAAWGTLFYAGGKFLFGSLADMLGGRRMFLLGMAGAIAFTVLFGAGGPPLFLVAWVGNRFIQASGWVGMVKITSRWFSHNVYGRVMGFISLSYLFGDFVSRLFLSKLIHYKVGWQSIFFISAVVLTVILVPTFFVIRDHPADRGMPEPPENPESLFAPEPEAAASPSLRSLLIPLLSSPTFWVVCVLSFGFTFMRETFNDWTPTYLHESAGMREEDAGYASSLFPLFGGFSVIAVGFLSDRLGRSGRALLITAGLAAGTVGLLALSSGAFKSQTAVVVALVAAIAFLLIGPYSLLAGAISLGFGGKKGSATAAGWIDGIGYIGGILSGNLIGSIAEHMGWEPALRILAITAAVSCVVSLVYWMQERRAMVTV